MSKKIGVVVSGRGSNLQSIIDHIAEGKLNVEIAVVVSDHKEAFALERAAKAGIPTAVVERKGCKDKAEFEDKIDAAPIRRCCPASRGWTPRARRWTTVLR